MKGVVTCNASTGETQYYDVSDVPSWVDIVYDGSMLTEQYDWYGMYSGGYMNSLFTNKDCKKVTDNYGFKMFDDDVWVFTGVTSVVSDESNIGFVLMNVYLKFICLSLKKMNEILQNRNSNFDI